jgi:phospholipid/cholesterol/gamma-HCH transport system permease protein
MSVSPQVAQASLQSTGTNWVLTVAGDWRMTARRPAWAPPNPPPSPAAGLRLELRDLGAWDSSLVLYLHHARAWAERHGLTFPAADLPPDLRRLVQTLATPPPPPEDHSHDFVTMVGNATLDAIGKSLAIVRFVGECTLATLRQLARPHRFRWGDTLHEMQRCGAMALPIVGLIAFLVGVTLAYTGAIILRQFGADIWVADLVALTMLREMGAVMTGIVMAGRTGAAFAAQLGNMKANEEIDALETLGIRAVDFLVLPRLLALTLMLPLLTLYANALGIIGGAVISYLILEIPFSAYWVELLTAVDGQDLAIGLIKAATFGLFVGLAGCLRGLQAERSAAGVGAAATSAVVTAIVLIIVGDALYAVLFNLLDW